MEAQIVNAAMQTLSNLPQKSLESVTEISVYKGNFNPIQATKTVMRLNKAFPGLTSDFISILLDRVKELNIPDERLKDSVNYLIDNYHYPTMTIADVVSYDKKIKLLTYDEALKNHSLMSGCIEFSKMYKPVDLGQKTTLFAKISDIDTYNLKIKNNENNNK